MIIGRTSFRNTDSAFGKAKRHQPIKACLVRFCCA